MVDNNDGADNGENGTPTPDANKNIQAEFYRKTEKLASEQASINQKLEQIASMLNQKQQPAAPTESEDDLEALAYKDPKMYAKKVREAAAMEASRVVDYRMQQQNQSNAVLSQLGAEYPELSDANSDLTKKAVEYYKALSKEDQMTPSAYKVAVRDAAADLGLLPKNKRKAAGDDSFSFSGGDSSTPRNSQKRDAEVDVRTLAFAEALGMNVKDKKVVDRIKQRAQRKNWGKYE